MKVLKEVYITENYRVRMSEADGEYLIEDQQDATKVSAFPWEVHKDGWRNCKFCFCSTLEKATKEFNDAVNSVKRYH